MLLSRPQQHNQWEKIVCSQLFPQAKRKEFKRERLSINIKATITLGDELPSCAMEQDTQGIH